MIQRIQTLLLLIVSVLMFTLLFTPLATLAGDPISLTWMAEGIQNSQTGELVTPLWAIFTLIIIMGALPFATIFLYKKRLMQVRFCIFNEVLMVAFYGLMLYYYYNGAMMMDTPELSLSLSPFLILPLLAAVLNIIAIRKIISDEVLVKSLDRIR